LADVWKKNKKGFIDKTGKEIIPFIYDITSEFSEGVACVGKKGEIGYKFGFIDKTGKEIIPCIYEGHSLGIGTKFSEDLAQVKISGKYGFVDKTGKEIIPCVFDGVEDFSEGVAAVKMAGSWGFIDKTGKEFIPYVFDIIYGGFSDGLANVKWNGQQGFVDKEGYFIGQGVVKNVFIVEEEIDEETLLPKADSFYENEESDLDNQVDLNSLASIQGYLSGKTFVSDNGVSFKIQSGTEVYMNGYLFGTIAEWLSVRRNSNNGRNFVPFNVVAPQNHTQWLFGFYPPNIIRDQEGTNYYLK